MDDQQSIQNLEVRLRRLEQLHIWAGGIIVLGIAYYFIKKK